MHILRNLGLADVAVVLLDDNPAAAVRLGGLGVAVAGRRPLPSDAEADVV